MNVPVQRVEFESRVRAWVDQDHDRNLQKLRAYLTANWPDASLSFETCDLDLLNECLWTWAQTQARLWADEAFDELMIEIRKTTDDNPDDRRRTTDDNPDDRRRTTDDKPPEDRRQTTDDGGQ